MTNPFDIETATVLTLVRLLLEKRLDVIAGYVYSRNSEVTIRLDDFKRVKITYVKKKGKRILKVFLRYQNNEIISFEIDPESFLKYVATLCSMDIVVSNICKFCHKVTVHGSKDNNDNVEKKNLKKEKEDQVVEA